MNTLKIENGSLFFLDQTKLPLSVEYIHINSLEVAAEAIKMLRVRGAPAIGVGAAFSLWVHLDGVRSVEEFCTELQHGFDVLDATRPTAVNLHWALMRMKNKAEELLSAGTELDDLKAGMLAEAQAIMDEDVAMCRAIGEYGAALLEDGMTVMTYCNAGSLAAIEYGTALAPVYRAIELGKRIKVIACETRPLLQGARLTSWELSQRGVDVTLICDNMAAAVMAAGKVDAVITGCDRVAANGDAANKIGTYGLSIIAAAHRVPFYIAAPASTLDAGTPNGDGIVIEERAPEEVSMIFGKRSAPVGVKVYNPAFDVTPAANISAFITEKGVIRPPYDFTQPR